MSVFFLATTYNSQCSLSSAITGITTGLLLTLPYAVHDNSSDCQLHHRSDCQAISLLSLQRAEDAADSLLSATEPTVQGGPPARSNVGH